MVRLEEKLEKEKRKLNEMIENYHGDLTNDFVLEQSRRVDSLIVCYQNIKKYCVSIPVDNIKYNIDNK